MALGHGPSETSPQLHTPGLPSRATACPRRLGVGAPGMHPNPNPLRLPQHCSSPCSLQHGAWHRQCPRGALGPPPPVTHLSCSPAPVSPSQGLRAPAPSPAPHRSPRPGPPLSSTLSTPQHLTAQGTWSSPSPGRAFAPNHEAGLGARSARKQCRSASPSRGHVPRVAEQPLRAGFASFLQCPPPTLISSSDAVRLR